MSWLFSQALVEAYSAQANCLAGAHSAPEGGMSRWGTNMPSEPRRWENELTPLNKIIARAEQTIAEAGPDVQVAFIMRQGDRITIRDNSGIEGLTDETLMKHALDLMHNLFPTFEK